MGGGEVSRQSSCSSLTPHPAYGSITRSGGRPHAMSRLGISQDGKLEREVPGVGVGG